MIIQYYIVPDDKTTSLSLHLQAKENGIGPPKFNFDYPENPMNYNS